MLGVLYENAIIMYKMHHVRVRMMTMEVFNIMASYIELNDLIVFFARNKLDFDAKITFDVASGELMEKCDIKRVFPNFVFRRVYYKCLINVKEVMAENVIIDNTCNHIGCTFITLEKIVACVPHVKYIVLKNISVFGRDKFVDVINLNRDAFNTDRNKVLNNLEKLTFVRCVISKINLGICSKLKCIKFKQCEINSDVINSLNMCFNMKIDTLKFYKCTFVMNLLHLKLNAKGVKVVVREGKEKK